MLSLNVDVPCIRGQYGNKLYTFQTSVQPKEIHNLLGHDPRSRNWSKLQKDLKDLYDNLQRKTNADRSRSTAEYIRTRIASNNRRDMIGAFPAISIGLVNVPIFHVYKEIAERTDNAIGYLKFDLSASNIRVLLDGLARVTGAMDLIDAGEIEAINCFTFPATIYAPTEETGNLTVQQLGQIFHDFNFLATPVSKSLAISLDQTDLYIALSRAIGECDVIKSRGGLEEKANKITKKSKAFVGQQYFLKFIRGACEGYDFQHSLRAAKPINAYLNSDTFDEIKNSIEYFLETLANLMGADFNNRDYIHHTSPGWCALGLIFHDWGIRLKDKLSDIEKADILRAIADIDWSRYNPDWKNILGSMEMDDTGRQKLNKNKGGGASATDLAQYIREKSGLHNKLKYYLPSQLEMDYS